MAIAHVFGVFVIVTSLARADRDTNAGGLSSILAEDEAAFQLEEQLGSVQEQRARQEVIEAVTKLSNGTSCRMNSDCGATEKCTSWTFGIGGAGTCVGCLSKEDDECKVVGDLEKTCCDGYSCRPKKLTKPMGTWTCQRSAIGMVKDHLATSECFINRQCEEGQKCHTLVFGLGGGAKCTSCLNTEVEKCSVFSPIEQTCCDGYTCRPKDMSKPKEDWACHRSVVGMVTDRVATSECSINSQCGDGKKCDTLVFGLGGGAKCTSCVNAEGQMCSVFSPIEQTCCDGYTCRPKEMSKPKGDWTCHRSVYGQIQDKLSPELEEERARVEAGGNQ